MKFINERVHAVLDYVVAIALVVAPFGLDLKSSSEVAHWMSVAAGIALFGYSLLTGYSLGFRKLIPMRVHLALDFSAGVAFVLAGLALGGTGLAPVYCLVVGGAVIAVVLFTETAPVSAKAPARA